MSIQAFIIAIKSVINLMQAVVIIRVACEFVPINRDLKPYKLIVSLSDPLLNPIRKILSKQDQGKRKDRGDILDISPVVVLVLLYMLNTLLKRYTY